MLARLGKRASLRIGMTPDYDALAFNKKGDEMKIKLKEIAEKVLEELEADDLPEGIKEKHVTLILDKAFDVLSDRDAFPASSVLSLLEEFASV